MELADGSGAGVWRFGPLAMPEMHCMPLFGSVDAGWVLTDR